MSVVWQVKSFIFSTLRYDYIKQTHYYHYFLYLINTNDLRQGRMLSVSPFRENVSKQNVLFAAVCHAKVVSFKHAVLDDCIQNSFVCSMKLYIAAQTDETRASALLRVSELVYLWLAQCQFYIQVKRRRKLHLPLCCLAWGGSLCLSQSAIEYSDKFQSVNHTVTDNDWWVHSVSFTVTVKCMLNEQN